MSGGDDSGGFQSRWRFGFTAGRTLLINTTWMNSDNEEKRVSDSLQLFFSSLVI